MENARSNAAITLLILGRLGELLGFPSNTTIQASTETESTGKVELNRGLRCVDQR